MDILPKNKLDCYKYNISANLKYLLNAYSISMLELSSSINASYSSIYDIIENKSNPTFKTLLKISEYFKLNISQLIGDVPIVNNRMRFLQRIPILKWDNAFIWLNNNHVSQKNEVNSILISTTKYFEKKLFALDNNKKNQPLFASNSILIFEQITSDLNKYDNNFILVKKNNNSLVLNKLLIEGSGIFLQPINEKLPPYQLESDSKVIAHLIQSILEF